MSSGLQNRWGKVPKLLCSLPWLAALATAHAGGAVHHMAQKNMAPQKAAISAAPPAAVPSTATPYAAPAPACFGEEQWQALQRSTAAPASQPAQKEQKEQKALLYVWSPRMVFSAVHAHEVQQEAQALGLRFVPVHDGRLPAEEVAQALSVLPQKLPPGRAAPHPHPLQASQPLCAPSLVERDAYRHFPTAWVVQQGGFHPVPLVSAMPPAFWKMGLQQRMQPPALPTPPAAEAESQR